MASVSLSWHVRVVVRVRPPISIEAGHGTSMLTLDPGGKTVAVASAVARGAAPGAAAPKPKFFAVDAVLGPGASQEAVYTTAGVDDMVAAVVKGYNATVFAYGQVLLLLLRSLRLSLLKGQHPARRRGRARHSRWRATTMSRWSWGGEGPWRPACSRARRLTTWAPSGWASRRGVRVSRGLVVDITCVVCARSRDGTV